MALLTTLKLKDVEDDYKVMTTPSMSGISSVASCQAR